MIALDGSLPHPCPRTSAGGICGLPLEMPLYWLICVHGLAIYQKLIFLSVLLNLSQLRFNYVSVDAILIRSYIKIREKIVLLFLY